MPSPPSPAPQLETTRSISRTKAASRAPPSVAPICSRTLSCWLARQYLVNAIGPALVAKHFLPIMKTGGITRFAALSARVGSISDNRLGGWYGYRASKAALNQLIRSLAIEWRRKNERSIVVGLHPGTVDTGLSKPFQGNVPEGKLFAADRAAVQLLDVLDDLKPGDSGKIFAWDGEEIAP